MGKRELLLVLAFVVAGAVLYRFTRPAPKPDDRSRSVSDVIAMAKREIQGNRSSANVTIAKTLPVGPAVEELAVTGSAKSLTLVGEARDDVSAELRVWSNGFDDSEARRLAGEVAIVPAETDKRLTLDLTYPEAGRQEAEVTLRVPLRLAVSVAKLRGDLTVRNVRAMKLVDTRGDTTIKDVADTLSGTHRGGDLTIAAVGSLALTVRDVDLRLTGVRGTAKLDVEGGSVRTADLAGGLDIKGRRADFEIDDLDTGPIHLDVEGGSLRFTRLGVELHAELRDADVEITLARAVPLTLSSEGHATIEVTPAAGGYTLDARARDGGRVKLPDGTPLEVVDADDEQHASGAVLGGGPTIAVTSARGDIVINEAARQKTLRAPAPAQLPKSLERVD